MDYSKQIPPDTLYEILPTYHLVSGTPFLIHKKTLILGDLHFGQKNALFVNSSTAPVSQNCFELTKKIVKVINTHSIKRVILNGDIKHATNSFIPQEKHDLWYFFDNIIGNQADLICIRGNHDLLIDYISPSGKNNFVIVDYVEEDYHVIFHGHETPDTAPKKVYIISHEHPAFTFKGYNKAKIKLPAFITIKLETSSVIILPAANEISGGVNFPPNELNGFLSPFLQKIYQESIMQIFPYDNELGVFLLPPFTNWARE